MSKDYWSKKKFVDSNVPTSEKKMEDRGDVKALYALEEDELAVMTMVRS